MQCAAERKYCAGVLGQLRGRAAAQLGGNVDLNCYPSPSPDHFLICLVELSQPKWSTLSSTYNQHVAGQEELSTPGLTVARVVSSGLELAQTTLERV